MLLKLYIYGYLNQVQSSRRLEREAGRNVELMWLTGKLAPDFKTVADFRRDHGAAIQAACRRFVLLCRNLGLIVGGTVAVDGSRMRAVNARDKNFTPVTIRRRMEQVDTSLANMGEQARAATGTDALTVLADRGYFSGPEILACEAAGITPICPKPLTSGAKADGRWGKQDFVYVPENDTYRCPAGETMTRRFSNTENGMTLHAYATPACRYRCGVKANCTTSIERRIKRWEHEEVIEAMQARLDRMPSAMRVRRRTVELVFGTLKDWMGRSHFKTRTLRNVRTETSLHILAYNIKRAIAMVGVPGLMAAMQA